MKRSQITLTPTICQRTKPGEVRVCTATSEGGWMWTASLGLDEVGYGFCQHSYLLRHEVTRWAFNRVRVYSGDAPESSL